MTVTGVGDPEEVRAIFVSDGALEALAVRPFLGRVAIESRTRLRGMRR